MLVIPPVKITDVNFISSNIPEPSSSEVSWNAATNYSLGAVVIRTTTHRKYECQVAGVDAGLPESTPDRWLDVGPTNRWAMFDQNRSIQSTNLNSIVVEVTPNKRINSVGLLGIEADTARIEMYDSLNNLVYDSGDKSVNSRNTLTWTDYFFGEFAYLPSLLLLDLPPYASARIKITLTNTGDTVKCSGVVLGSKVILGKTQYNAKSDCLNFSKIERDEFGNSLLIPRRTIPKTQQTLYTDKSLVNVARKVREQLNAVPALWSGLDEENTHDYFEAILIFGVYKQFEIDLAHPTVAYINLELEEL